MKSTRMAGEDPRTHARVRVTTIVDAHVHFWEPGTLEYPWLRDLPVLEKPFLSAAYGAAVGELPVTQCVLVEGNCLPADNMREVALFERLAQMDARVGGIVAFADLTQPAALAATLDCLTSTPRVKGIRQNIQGQPSGFALQRAFVNGVRELGRRGLIFDLCVTHDQLGEAIALVGQCPDASFVLDHCGKPGIRTGTREPWQSDIARLASRENVCCKLSGLLTEADLTHWRDDDLLPYAAHVTECFGTDRILYGSDWPVLTLAGEYADWFGFTARFTEGWSEDERQRFYADNATRVYGL